MLCNIQIEICYVEQGIRNHGSSIHGISMCNVRQRLATEIPVVMGGMLKEQSHLYNHTSQILYDPGLGFYNT
jgi:hypothetical protein